MGILPNVECCYGCIFHLDLEAEYFCYFCPLIRLCIAYDKHRKAGTLTRKWAVRMRHRYTRRLARFDLRIRYMLVPPLDIQFPDDSNEYYESKGKVWFICGSYNHYHNRISIYFRGLNADPREPLEGSLSEMVLHELLHWADWDATEKEVHQMAYKLIWDRVFKEV